MVRCRLLPGGHFSPGFFGCHSRLREYASKGGLASSSYRDSSVRVRSLLSCPTCAKHRNIIDRPFLDGLVKCRRHASASVTRGIAALRTAAVIFIWRTQKYPPERGQGASKGDIIGPGGGTAQNLSGERVHRKVLPVALLSMRPLFVRANRHYSTVCHSIIRWFFAVCGVRTMQYGYGDKRTMFRDCDVF